MNPKSLQANIDLANFYYLQSKLPQAQEVLQAQSLEIPTAPELYVDWANMLSDTGKTTEAEGVLDKLAEPSSKVARGRNRNRRL